MKLTLSIDLGSAAMLTGDDLAKALRAIAVILDGATAEDIGDDSLNGHRGAGIRDSNGNKVGYWDIVPGSTWDANGRLTP